MKFRALSLASVLFASTEGGAETLTIEGQVERPILESPMSLILKEYNASQILALGESHHLKYQSYEYFQQLIQTVGTDPNLKYVITESPIDFGPFLNFLGHYSLDEAIKRAGLDEKETKKRICSSKMFAYMVARVFPAVRVANAKRPLSNQLVIYPVDGILALKKNRLQAAAAKHPHKAVDTCSGDVKRNLEDWTDYSNSARRERDTSRNFEKRIFPNLGNRKAIVIYHSAHLIKEVNACAFDTEDGVNWKSSWAPVSWIGRLLRDNPHLRRAVRTILLDERSPTEPHGSTLISQEISASNPQRSWGVETRVLDGHANARMGINNFTPEAFMSQSNDGVLKAVSPLLSEMFDGLIWTAGGVDVKLYPKPSAFFDFCR